MKSKLLIYGILVLVVIGVILVSGCVQKELLKELDGEWPLLLKEPYLSLRIDVPSREYPKGGEDFEIILRIANFGNNTYPADDYIIRLYYAPLKIVNITAIGAVSMKWMETIPFEKIAEWQETIKPSQKIDNLFYNWSVEKKYIWILPEQPQDGYELRATVEKIVSKPLITEIVTWGRDSLTTFEGKEKIEEETERAKAEVCERGGSIEITDYYYDSAKNELMVEVKITGSVALTFSSINVGWRGGGGFRGLNIDLNPDETTLIIYELTSINSTEDLTKIKIETLCPEVYDEVYGT